LCNAIEGLSGARTPRPPPMGGGCKRRDRVLWVKNDTLMKRGGRKHRLVTLGHISTLESTRNPGAITLLLHHCKRMMREAQGAQEIIEYPMRILMRKKIDRAREHIIFSI
jgi:hypothetical protein